MRHLATITALMPLCCLLLVEARVEREHGPAGNKAWLRREMETKADGDIEDLDGSTGDDRWEDASVDTNSSNPTPAPPPAQNSGAPTPSWQTTEHPPDGSADPTTTLAPIPPDVHEGLIKEGWCSNWQEGSSVRELGALKSYWGPEHGGLTERECFFNCDDDGACEQASYNHSTKECWLGINAMSADPEPCHHHGCNNTCYAKHGWSHSLALDVKDGWCSEFQEGWGGTGVHTGATQCDLNSHSVESQKECSHWGAEYGLSERGCWVKCQENSACKQAVYEANELDGDWSCFIGTNPMHVDPGPSRCTNCNNRCYAPLGFGGTTDDVVSGHDATQRHSSNSSHNGSSSNSSSPHNGGTTTNGGSDGGVNGGLGWDR